MGSHRFKVALRLTATAVPEPVTTAGSWSLRNASIPLADPVVMGILNMTPDSFSDGGTNTDLAAAVDNAGSWGWREAPACAQCSAYG